MSLDNRVALDTIDHFIRAGGDIAKLPILREPGFRPAAEDLYQIAQKLLVSNEYMARWLNGFLQFDFRQGDARGQFMKLAGDYRTTKSGMGFHEMKFNCGDISIIYYRNIDASLHEMFPDDQSVMEATRTAFLDLGNADADMVAYIYDTVVIGIDNFVDRTEEYLDNSDLNAAEAERLKFKVASRELSARLVRFGNELSDLVLTYAGLAQRSITLAD